MWLAPQEYNLDVQYKKGTLMHIADPLSRAYLKTTDGAQMEFCEIRALETVDHDEHMKLNHRNKTFSVNKLLRIVISWNLSVLSSQDGLK